MFRLIVFAGLASLSGAVVATPPDECLEKAMTQDEMNTCADVQLADVQKEMKRVLETIEDRYASNGPFIESLRSSQKAWDESSAADMNMMYPGDDKRAIYGSVYPLCRNMLLVQLTLARLAFLKQWLAGSETGDVCTGSIMNSYCLTHDCSKIRKQLKTGVSRPEVVPIDSSTTAIG